MLLPIRPHGGSSPRPPGEVTYMGPCVSVGGDRFAWESIPRTPRSIGEMTYMGPSLRPEDLRGRY